MSEASRARGRRRVTELRLRHCEQLRRRERAGEEAVLRRVVAVSCARLWPMTKGQLVMVGCGELEMLGAVTVDYEALVKVVM